MPVASVRLTPAGDFTLHPGAERTLAAAALDASGNVLAGRTIIWNTTFVAGNAVTVTPTPTATGATSVVTGFELGTATITATSEGRGTTVTVNVVPVPVVSVVIAPPSLLAIGGSQTLVATPRDSIGGALTGRMVTWLSLTPAVATVTPGGLVTGVGPGTATVTATIDGVVGTTAVTVSAVPAPVIGGITPSLLTPGTSAVITGANFGATVAENGVTIDGAAATVTSVSPTRLVVTVGALPCALTHDATVTVHANGLASSMAHPARSAVAVSPGVGAPLLLSAEEAACAELPAGNGYMLTVVNTAQAPTAVTPFRIEIGVGSPASPSAGPAGTTYLRQPVAAPAPRTGATEPGEALHARILEENAAVFARLRATARRGATAGSGPGGRASRALVPLPTIGSTRKFRVAQFSTAVGAVGSCTSNVEITARAVYVGTRAVVYEDVAAPLAGTMDDRLRQVGAEFDDPMYGVVSTYFGDPLVTDATTDADQHLTMVFTPSITPGVAGFVTGCDFFPPAADNTTSNFGEYFYAVVPTVAGSGFSGNTADSWYRTMRHTVVHEVKHIASIGGRIAAGAPRTEESWLEEGMARHAEELWARNHVYHVPWKGNTGYAASLYCDVRPTFAECAGAPFVMFGHFATLWDVLAAPGASSLFGRVTDGDFNFYAASWSFVRWAADRHASSEAAFLRGITQQTSRTGLASLAAVTGRPEAELLTSWTLAFFFDGFTGASDEVQIPTWHTKDIFRSMSADFPTSFPRTHPLLPMTLAPRAQTIDNAGIHGGGFAMYQIVAPTPALALRGAALGGGGALAPTLRIAVVRIP